MVYPAPPFVVVKQFWFLPFPLSQVGQSDLLHVAASVGEFFVIRDFRDTPPPQESKGPPLRPVCHASTAPNNVLSSVLSPIIKFIAEDRAIASSEEMVATVKTANENAATRERKIGIGSMDCKALYLSLTREWVVKIVTRMMAKTKVKGRVCKLE